MEWKPNFPDDEHMKGPDEKDSDKLIMADDAAISVCTMKPAVGEAGQKAGSNELELEKLNLTEGSAISENMVMIKDDEHMKGPDEKDSDKLIMADDAAISVCTMKPAVGEAGQKAGSNELELEKLNLTEGSAISENMVMIKGKKQQLIFQHTGPVIIGDHTKVIVNNVGCPGKGEDIRQEQHVKETLTKDDARDKLKKKRRNHDYQGSCSGQQNEKTKDLPDRVPTPKEIGRVSKYIGFSYQLFFVELNCPRIVIEQEMEEYRHLSFRSRITKIFLRLLKTEEDITFIDVANAMQKHGMDPSSLHNIIDCNSDVIFRDERLADSVLHNALSLQDIPIVAEYLEVKSYVNFFLDVGFLPKTIDEFDDKFKTKKTHMKINAMLNTFLNETNPRPTLNTILLAMETCEMDTISLISALNLI